MSEEEQTLLLIKGAIADLPVADQQKVLDCAAQLRVSITHFGPAGAMAMALVGAEAQAGRIDFNGGSHG